MMEGFGEHGWEMGLGWMSSLVALVFVIIIVVLLIRNFRNPRQRSSLDILKDRYARGEISHAEFSDKKRELR